MHFYSKTTSSISLKNISLESMITFLENTIKPSYPKKNKPKTLQRPKSAKNERNGNNIVVFKFSDFVNYTIIKLLKTKDHFLDFFDFGTSFL